MPLPHEHGDAGAARMDNAQVALMLERIADLLEIQGENAFKVTAYRRAAASILELGEDIGTVWHEGRLGEIPGVGEALEKKLDEMLRTGQLELLSRLQAQVPPGVLELLEIPGVGPKTARLMWEKLGITSVDEAEQAAQRGGLRDLPGLGVRSEARILSGIQELRRRDRS